ncbi:DEAD/DEAH box helicase, partial [Vibrio anguillarum]
PQEVLSRKLMRENPAPILVTNGTMLEYMLVRQADAPIIQKSQGKLRWIVLDEAHTYIGSQAAELALQLRRVMQAFDVKPEDIRFIATSAT